MEKGGLELTLLYVTMKGMLVVDVLICWGKRRVID